MNHLWLFRDTNEVPALIPAALISSLPAIAESTICLLPKVPLYLLNHLMLPFLICHLLLFKYDAFQPPITTLHSVLPSHISGAFRHSDTYKAYNHPVELTVCHNCSIQFIAPSAWNMELSTKNMRRTRDIITFEHPWKILKLILSSTISFCNKSMQLLLSKQIQLQVWLHINTIILVYIYTSSEKVQELWQDLEQRRNTKLQILKRPSSIKNRITMSIL